MRKTREKSSQKRTRADTEFPLNGLSLESLTLSQDGDVEVEFALPQDQTTAQWYTELRASRNLDVYEDPELEAACRHLFQLVRERLREPDPERLELHCDRCSTSDCCRKYNVLLRDEDIERLAPAIDLTAEEFTRRYTDPAVDWCGDFKRQLRADEDEDGEEKCVFLKKDQLGRWRCSVYEHRPRICRDFDMNTCDDFVALEDVTTLVD
ncbi:MAG: YkgJ family cysteine cluster protein [Planctomycetota bacterium]|nr:YkgJ family cysteine cluster protein [Planctomycetota bacterium]